MFCCGCCAEIVQIDPFGHASSTPIFFAQMGFSFTVTDRVNTLLTLERIQAKEMEYVWHSPAPWNRREAELQIFTHQLGLLIYNFPGFTFENSDGGPGDPRVTPSNLHIYKDIFETSIDARRLAYATPDLLVPWGGDFLFYNGSQEWASMDPVMATQSDAHYALITDYFAALHKMNRSWPTYVGDFLPYQVPVDVVWSGYFSSRAALKGASRRLDCLIEAADAFLVLAGNASTFPLLDAMRDARRYSGILCHHDAITGTARDFVVLDYFQMIANATKLATSVLEAAASSLAGAPLSAVQTNPNSNVVVLATTSAAATTFRTDQSVAGRGASTSGISCQVSPFNTQTFVHMQQAPPKFSLLPVTLPRCFTNAATQPSGSFVVANDAYELQFGEEQYLVSIVDKRAGVKRMMAHSLARYWEIDGSCYLFRADPAGARIVWGSLQTFVSKGLVVTEVRQQLTGANTISWTWRIYDNVIEVEYDVQLVQSGFSYVVRYDTGLATNSTFYTDDQGYQTLQRTLDPTSRVEYNYFPGVEHVYVQDNKGTRFNVVTSQTNGVTSSIDGRLEMMIFRRLLNSGFPPMGMGQALDDTAPSKQTHRLSFGTDVVADRIFMSNAPTVLFPKTATSVRAYRASIPDSFPLHVLSLKAVRSFVMLRLQNWDMTNDVSFNVNSIFGITNATEYGLSFGAPYQAVQKSRVLFNQGRTLPRNPGVVEAGLIRSYAVSM